MELDETQRNIRQVPHADQEHDVWRYKRAQSKQGTANLYSNLKKMLSLSHNWTNWSASLFAQSHGRLRRPQNKLKDVVRSVPLLYYCNGISFNPSPGHKSQQSYAKYGFIGRLGEARFRGSTTTAHQAVRGREVHDAVSAIHKTWVLNVGPS